MNILDHKSGFQAHRRPMWVVLICALLYFIAAPLAGQTVADAGQNDERETTSEAKQSLNRQSAQKVPQQVGALSILNNSGTNLMQIEENGNVGIGSTNPVSKLQVIGTVNASFFVGNGSGLTNLPIIDNSLTNEIQSLSLSGNTLSLSLGGGSVSLASFASPWNNSGSNLYFNTGKVGIGDNSPVATLTVGNGDKFQVHGSDGDIVLKDDQGSLRFANSNGSNAPMIQMFPSGTNNSTRMFVAHSPNFSSWGIQYNDTSDAFNYIGDNQPVFQVQLSGQQRIGVGTFSPEAKVHINANSSTGVGHLKLTETQFDYSRITLNNNIHNTYWDIAARTDTNLVNSKLNFYHSGVGDILTINGNRRIGINDATPNYPLDVDGNGESRTIDVRNNIPTTSTATFNYGVISNLTQDANNGFPRLFNIYGFSTDFDAYLSYGVYGFASNASNFNYGLYGVASTNNGYAVYGSGNMYCTGQYLPSDRKLKRNAESYRQGLQTVMALQPTRYEYDLQRYDFMNLPEGEQYGFVADEVRQVLPNLVKRSFQGYDEQQIATREGQGVEFEAVNYTALIPVLVSAIQEQQETIETLKQRIRDLENK